MFAFRHQGPDQRVPAGAAEQAVLVRLPGLHGVQIPTPAKPISGFNDVFARDTIYCR